MHEIKRGRRQGTGVEGKVEGMKWRVQIVEAPRMPAAGRRVWSVRGECKVQHAWCMIKSKVARCGECNTCCRL